MSEQHTQGGLRLERDPMHFDSMTSLRGGEHRMHLGLPDELMIEVGGWSPAGEANARRLKACWDLLVDVPTKEIEAAANYGASWGKTGLWLAALTSKLEELRTENACLRAELEAAGRWFPMSEPQVQCAKTIAQAAPVPPQKPELRVGQIWRTRGGDVVEIESETENSPRPFVCGFPGQARCKLTVTKNGTVYESAQHPADLIKLIIDVQKGGEA